MQINKQTKKTSKTSKFKKQKFFLFESLLEKSKMLNKTMMSREAVRIPNSFLIQLIPLSFDILNLVTQKSYDTTLVFF